MSLFLQVDLLAGSVVDESVPFKDVSSKQAGEFHDKFPTRHVETCEIVLGNVNHSSP